MDDILINLNIISKIKPYDKIYINKNNLITIEYNTLLQGLFRFLYNNNREKNINNLNNFYKTVFNVIDDLLNSPYINNYNTDLELDDDEFFKTFNNFKKLSHYLELSLVGLNNLKQTYNDDIVIDSKIDLMINNTELYSQKINKKITNIEKKYNLNDDELLNTI